MFCNCEKFPLVLVLIPCKRILTSLLNGRALIIFFNREIGLVILPINKYIDMLKAQKSVSKRTNRLTSYYLCTLLRRSMKVSKKSLRHQICALGRPCFQMEKDLMYALDMQEALSSLFACSAWEAPLIAFLQEKLTCLLQMPLVHFD